jgi:hypothetical protein
MMLRSPQNALYWGSYLMKICNETKSLCMQFESVVTNSELSFKDIAFLELDPRVAALFKLSESGEIDCKRCLMILVRSQVISPKRTSKRI